MRMRVAGTAAAGLVVALGMSAVAAPPKKVCNLVSDRSGDAKGMGARPAGQELGQNTQALDIVSADLASHAGTVTTVIRVAKLAAKEPTAPTGMTWRMAFKVGDHVLFTRAVADRDGNLVYDYGSQDQLGGAAYKREGTATGIFDTAKNEIRISAPVNGFLKTKPSVGKQAINLAADAGRNHVESLSPHPISADYANTTNAYTLGAPSCVVVGK